MEIYGQGLQRSMAQFWPQDFKDFYLKVVLQRHRYDCTTIPDPVRRVNKKAEIKKSEPILSDGLCVGVDLFSRLVAKQVSSALVSLTSVFGMGTGGPSPLETPTASEKTSLRFVPLTTDLRFVPFPLPLRFKPACAGLRIENQGTFLYPEN